MKNSIVYTLFGMLSLLSTVAYAEEPKAGTTITPVPVRGCCNLNARVAPYCLWLKPEPNWEFCSQSGGYKHIGCIADQTTCLLLQLNSDPCAGFNKKACTSQTKPPKPYTFTLGFTRRGGCKPSSYDPGTLSCWTNVYPASEGSTKTEQSIETLQEEEALLKSGKSSY